MENKLLIICQAILQQDIEENEAVNQTCQLLLEKEYWRKTKAYPFTLTEILELHRVYRLFHTQEGKNYFSEKEKEKENQKPNEAKNRCL